MIAIFYHYESPELDHFESHEFDHSEAHHYSFMRDESGLIDNNLTNVVQYSTSQVLRLWSLNPIKWFKITS